MALGSFLTLLYWCLTHNYTVFKDIHNKHKRYTTTIFSNDMFSFLLVSIGPL